MVIHMADIDDIKATRDSLFTFIDDVLQRNSATDIVMAADELPDVSDNTSPVPPLCKQPQIADYDIIIQSVKDLVKYKKQVCTHVSRCTSGHRNDVVPPGPVPTHFGHVSPHLSGSPVAVGARSKKVGGGKIAWDDIVPQPPVSREYTQVWEIKPGGSMYDVLWDEKGLVWWMRTNNRGLYQYDMGGSLVTRVGDRLPVLKGGGHICIDTKRGLLVTTDNNSRVVCMRKSDKLVKEFTVPGCGLLSGITYCPHRDIYVVSDIGKHCLWFIDSDSGQVVQQLGSGGCGNDLFNCPWFICHQPINHNTCHIVVSDSDNHCIKVFSHTGEFIRRFGSKGSGERQLNIPRGVCVDDQGWVVVCDMANQRVVRYWWDESEKWEVILNTEQLKFSKPVCVSMTPDGRHLVVGMAVSHKYRCYTGGL